jgi:putative redox protein
MYLDNAENLTTAILRNDKLQMQINAEPHFLLSDEPVEEGGDGTAPDPFELLSASLSACTLATLQLYLKRKDWKIKLVSVQVSFTDNDSSGVKAAYFIKTIKVSGTIDDTQRKRLILIADACPISKILKSGRNRIESNIVT